MVVGDFNVITGPEEKIGGLPYKIEESLDFISCLDDCDFQDVGYLGPKFTWSEKETHPIQCGRGFIDLLIITIVLIFLMGPRLLIYLELALTTPPY